MTAADPIQVNQVAAYIGPVVAAIIGLGGLVGWIINRVGKSVNSKFDTLAALGEAQQKARDERMEAILRQLDNQATTLTAQNQQLLATSNSVARIEGRLGVRGDGSPGGSL